MMPLTDSILNIQGYGIEKVLSSNPLIFEVCYKKASCCRYCSSSSLRLKDSFRRKIRHESMGSRVVYLMLRAHKYLCRVCGKYFNDLFPGILRHQRSTEGFRKEVFHKHLDGISQKALSKRLFIGQATIERWYQSFLKVLSSRVINNPSPRVLGIDEHFFTKKKGYATTLCDLGGRRIYDVVLGRTSSSLRNYLSNIHNPDNTKVIVMDLSESYRRIAKEHFGHAKIVADRFHVIRLVNHHFLKTWQLIDPLGRKNRGLLSLMRRHEWRMTYDQKRRLSQYFYKNPALYAIWGFKHKLMTLLLKKKQTARQCRRLIPIFLRYIDSLVNSKFEPLITLGKTLRSWSEEIVRMFRFTRSNGITEGFHNKMEQISRRAYGFRNFNNYRLRVRALCS